MANAADTTLLSWIATEVNQALSGVREQLAKVASEPANAALLATCPSHLHQVSGALRMVGLSGATRFCEAIEGSFQGGAPGAPPLGVIDRAVQALKEFVDGLERGQANVPLRLFPVYRELKADAAEKDLFFPDVSTPTPRHPNAKSVQLAEIQSYVQAQRAVFQRGLLAWLRGQPVGGLKDMREAVDALHQVADQLPPPHGIWWVALGLLEALEHEKDPEWLAGAKVLGNKIDRQMRSGTPTANEALLCEMLYAIAKCSAATPHIKEIRAHYQLESLFPEPSRGDSAMTELSPEEMEAVLYDLHSRLDSLKAAWVQYVSGEQKTAGRFRELVNSFQAKATQLGNAHLTKLLGAIGLVTKHLPDPYPRQNQFMVIEMASAFLLIESVIDHFTSPAPDLEQQIVILGGWLLDSAKGKSSGEPPAGLRGDLVQQIGALQLRAQVAREILANLQHIEQVLDAFARDPSKRDTLVALRPYMRQIHGALVVLRFERAAEVLTLCEQMLAECAKPQHGMTAEDMDWIAEGLSSLGFYLDPCVHGREPATQAIELFFSRFGKRTAQIDFTLKIDLPEKQKTEEPKARSGVDQELLDIFLEEAAEVVQNMEAAVPKCAANPQDAESLAVIRRGFHTLKGSGRMVGLMDLGEIAWEIEQLFNFWLEEKRPATPGLLALVSDACKQYAGWVAQLRAGTLAGEVQAEDLVSAARRLKTQEPELRPEAAAVPAPVPAPELEPAPAEPPFMEIYMKEAADHVVALETEFARWQLGDEASHEFMRAAHTLASSSRTAGCPEVAELAGTVEQWIPFSRQVSAAEDRAVLAAAIARLRAMAEAVARRERPSSASAEVGRLEALIARLEANPPPPVDSSQPLKVVETRPVPEAGAAKPPEDGKAKRVMRDDIDEQLLPIFLEEAQELVPMIGGDLRDWKANPADDKVSASLRRALHTMKGSARMAGAIRLGELTHIMESRIEAAIEANAFPAELFAELEEKMDRMSLDVERMRTVPVDQVRAEPLALTQFVDPKKVLPKPEAAAAAPPAAPKSEAPLPSPAAMLRVNADVLDQLINEAGEVAIARSRVEAELRVIKQAMTDLQDSISRLRTQLREVEVQADSQMQSRLSVLEER